MKTILISAYALSPTKGSEFNVGWEFITRLSKENRVIVLYGVSDKHMGETVEIDNYFALNPSANLIPIKVKVPYISKVFNHFNRKGLGYAFYFALYFWQRQAYKEALHVIKSYHVDIIHQLNPIGFREPGYLWKVGKPMVWGPIGGANFVKISLLGSQPLKSKILFTLKNIITFLQIKLSPRVNIALKRADLVLFCNSENKNNLLDDRVQNYAVISEQACNIICSSNMKFYSENCLSISPIKLVVVGSLFHIKNIKFLMDVLGSLKNCISVQLNVVGDGHLKEELLEYSYRMGIANNITWHGHKSRSEVLDIMRDSDLHCLCSLSEANTTVVYEAFSVALPTISLNQNGMMDTLSDGMGFLVDINSYEATVKNYANKIKNIYFDRSVLSICSNKIIRNIDNLSWDAKIRKINDYYNELLK